MKKLLPLALLAAALPFLTETTSAVVLLTDNFTVTSNSQNVNQELAGRQGGTMAPLTYTSSTNNHHQVGNSATDVGQPGGAPNSNFVLLATNGWFRSDMDVGGSAIGPLTIGFDLYVRGTNPGGGAADRWGAFTLRADSDGWPIAGAGEFGFLIRGNGGMQVFQNGASINPAGWDTANFAMADRWTLTFSNTAGTGSAFNGTGSQVTLMNGSTTIGTLALGQLNSTGLKLGFRNYENRYVGIDNLSVSTVPEPAAALLVPAALGLMALRRRKPGM